MRLLNSGLVDILFCELFIWLPHFSWAVGLFISRNFLYFREIIPLSIMSYKYYCPVYHLSFERPYYHIDTHINLFILIAFLVGMTNFFPVKDKLKFVGKNTKTKMSSFFILKGQQWRWALSDVKTALKMRPSHMRASQVIQCKESTGQCRRPKGRGRDPWVGKTPWSRKWQPALVFLPGESSWIEESGRSMDSQRIRHDWVTEHCLWHMKW